MGIALSLKEYLDENEIEYDLVLHDPTTCSSRTAQASHVSGHDLAKGVVVKGKKSYLIAIVPASKQLRLRKMGRWLKQPVCLATEDELVELFADCEHGAVPPIGAPYGLKSVIDDELQGHDDIFFEAGDHVTLIHMTGSEFDRLTKKVPHENIGRAMNSESELEAQKYHFWGS